MGRLTVNSGCNGFVLIDAIEAVDQQSIDAHRAFHQAPLYLGIEALAQLGAMHVRYTTDFKKHAFLLKINHCRLPDAEALDGFYHLSGKRVSESSRAFAYALTATGDSGDAITGEFMFATIDYDTNFQQDVLANHYKQLFRCLKTDSKTG